MKRRLAVHVCGDDPAAEAEVASRLLELPEVYVVAARCGGDADVTIVVVDELDRGAESRIRSLQEHDHDPVVVVGDTIDDEALMRAAEMGVVGLLRRHEVTPEQLVVAVVAAARGDGQMAPDLLGRLLAQLSRVPRRVRTTNGAGPDGFTTREIEVLRLLADGFDTPEIAHALFFSERTIKNVIHDVTSRLQLRNRSHAVAFAMRNGVI